MLGKRAVVLHLQLGDVRRCWKHDGVAHLRMEAPILESVHLARTRRRATQLREEVDTPTSSRVRTRDRETKRIRWAHQATGARPRRARRLRRGGPGVKAERSLLQPEGVSMPIVHCSMECNELHFQAKPVSSQSEHCSARNILRRWKPGSAWLPWLTSPWAVWSSSETACPAQQSREAWLRASEQQTAPTGRTASPGRAPPVAARSRGEHRVHPERQGSKCKSKNTRQRGRESGADVHTTSSAHLAVVVPPRVVDEALVSKVKRAVESRSGIRCHRGSQSRVSAGRGS